MRITIHTLSDGERFEHSYDGALLNKNGKTYLNYNDGTEQCSLVSDNGVMRLCRLKSGSRLVFEKHEHHPSVYPTPMGNISVSVFTELLADKLLQSGTAYIKYRLYFSEEAYVKNEISITVKEIIE